MAAGLIAAVFSTQTAAQSARWSVAEGEAKACSTGPRAGCVTLRCAPDGKLNYTVNGGGVRPGKGQIIVDGRAYGSGTFGGQQGFASVLLDPRGNASILAAIRKGKRLRTALPGRSVDVTLSGSSAALNALLKTCTQPLAAAPHAAKSANTWAAHNRRADEATVTVPDIDLVRSQFTRTRNADIWGGDLRTGLDDPLLKGITEEACGRLCIATEGCGAYTWNGKDGDVCFLKTGGGRMARYTGATSGILNRKNEVHLPPPTRGPLPAQDEAVAWRQGDTVLAQVDRLRKASVPLARSCEDERADLEQLAQTLTLDIDTRRLTVGETARLSWSGNTLTERIPVWVVASTPSLTRIEGPGAMVLGPGATGPFGLAHARNQLRAFVSLWSRGAATQGDIRIRPLRAGDMAVQLSLVAYLRQCQQEVVLSQKSVTIPVDQASATLVVGTPQSRADLTHRMDSPAFDRRMEAGQTRVRITALSDATEVIERAGADARLSPTGRFLTIRHNGVTEVLDVIDGATVGRLRSADSQIHWGMADSVVFGSSAPWANVDLLFPFNARMGLDRQLTGPSCCNATPEATHLTVDPANGLLTVRGNLGHAIVPIQGTAFAFEAAGSGYAASGAWSAPMQLIALRSIGLVAPVTLAKGYSLPGGTQPLGPKITDIGTPIPRQDRIAAIETASILRGAGGGQSGALGVFERIGLQLAPYAEARPLLEAFHRENTGSDATAKRDDATAQALSAELALIGEKAGWQFDLLATPLGNYNASDCFDFLDVAAGDLSPSEAEYYKQTEFRRDGRLALPKEIDQLDHLRTPDADLVVGRVSCVAGATGGALRGYSGIFLLDLAQGQQPDRMRDAAVLEYGYMISNFEPQFQDDPFKARLFGRQLVLFTPGAGGIAVVDLDQGKVTRLLRNLPSGDLLSDAYLTADQRHVLQLNRDGSFAAWNIASGAQKLAGRIVDDEIAVWTEDFRFDATAEAASLIDLRFPGLDGQFSLEQFSAALHVDGLAARVLNGEDIRAAEVAVPPDLQGDIQLDSGNIRLSAALSPGRHAAQLRLYQDGVLTDSFPLAPDQQAFDFKAPRLGGARHAAMVAVSDEGLASAPLTRDLGPAPEGGTRRALAVAVDLYADPNLQDLNYAKADADRLMRSLAGLPQDVPAFEAPRFVGGRRAAPDDVLTAIDALLDGLAEDGHAVLFFAGHGLQGADGRYYLAMHQTDLTDLPGTALSFDEIAARLATTKARVTILIDACHSGDAGTGVFATNDGATAGLSQIPANITLVAASKGRQFSIEADALAGGLFTVALERVVSLERSRHDRNENGRIEASELIDGLRQIVEGQSEGKQVPWMTKGRIVGDFSLF
ncbi:caspase family protein [Tropicibacter naphthalenivorans]|uniref:caspase family protein n=1 Tax=Tropicibacter naphthalenivorans TaxID=441103 RepID=UPI001C91E384|nr:caspase family protein [Tropicibacter naphthalenivorans]